MPKKDVSSIIARGTPLQRITLYANHIAETSLGGAGLLTEAELNKLYNSFETASEIRLYNKFKKADLVVKQALFYLQQTRLGYREQIAFLVAYSIHWSNFKDIRETFNDILYTIGKKNKALRKKILDIMVNTNAVMAQFKEEEGQVVLSVEPKDFKGLNYLKGNFARAWKEHRAEERYEGEGYLRLLLLAHKDNAEGYLIRAKALIKALNDYMEEQGFKIKAYRRFVEAVEADLHEDKSPIEIYSEKRTLESLKDSRFNNEDHKKDFLDEVSKYFVFPDYSKIELDQAEYRKFKEGFFDAE